MEDGHRMPPVCMKRSKEAGTIAGAVIAPTIVPASPETAELTYDGQYLHP